MNIQKAARKKQNGFHKVFLAFVTTQLQGGYFEGLINLAEPIYMKPEFSTDDELTFLAVCYQIKGTWSKPLFGRLAIFCSRQNVHYTLHLEGSCITFYILDFKFLPVLEGAEV